MENKINIAELLKDCPKGMKLYSPIFGDVYLDKIRPHLAIVVTTDKEQGDFKEEFLYDGRYGMNGECMLFPSKNKTTWEGFHIPFRNGDIVAFDNPHRDNLQVFIFKNKEENSTLSSCYLMLDGDVLDLEEGMYYVTRLATEEEKAILFDTIKANGYKWNAETKTLEKLTEPKFKDGDIITDSLGTCIFKGEGEFEGTVNYYCGISNDYFRVKDNKCNPSGHYGYIVKYRLATEEEKQKLFDAIKANGYKWNEETKTLEKLTESKEDVDDEILMSGIYFDRKYYADEVELHLDNYEIEIRDSRTYAVFKNQKTKTFEQPKFKVGDRIRTKKDAPINMSNILITKVNECSYEGVIGYTTNLAHISFKYQDLYELAPHKFDINTLKPFDKVLVRSNSGKKWTIDFFGVIDNYNKYPFTCLGHSVTQCIPYEGNQHLLDTTDDCDEFYKTWKE